MQIKVQQNFNSLSVYPELHSFDFKKLIALIKYGKVKTTLKITRKNLSQTGWLEVFIA